MIDIVILILAAALFQIVIVGMTFAAGFKAGASRVGRALCEEQLLILRRAMICERCWASLSATARRRRLELELELEAAKA